MILRPVRTSQPQGPARIDWSNPITRGLISFIDNSANSGELVKTPSRFGVALQSQASTGNGLVLPSAKRNTGNGTILLLADHRVNASYGEYFWDGTGSSNRDLFYLQGPAQGANAALFGWYINSVSIADNDRLPLIDANFFDSGPAFLWWTPSVQRTYTKGVQSQQWTRTVTAGPERGVRIGSRFSGVENMTASKLVQRAEWNRALSGAEIKSLSDNPWQIFAPDAKSLWVPDTVYAGGGATVIPIGVQATGSVGTPSATGEARATPAGVSASSAVGTPVAVGGASIPATVLPAGVQATSAIGAVSATGAAVAQPVGVVASSAVGTPVAIAGTSIPATVLPAGVQASGAVGTPAAQGAAIAQPLGVAATAYVGTPTIATGASGVAVAYPAGVQAIGQVGTLIATGAAWTAAVGVQAVASVGTPTAYAGEIVIYVAGAQTRPSRLQSSSRASRLQTGTRASR